MSDREELAAGVPGQKAKGVQSEPTAPSQVKSSQAPDLTAVTGPAHIPEGQAGVPSQRPIHHKPVKDAGSQKRTELFAADSIAALDDDTFTVGRLFSNPVLMAGFVLCLASLLIVILSEVLRFIQSIQAAPLVLQVIAYGCMTVLIIAFFWAIVRLAIAYWQLTTSPQVRLDQIRDARGRAVIRDQIDRQVDAGYEALTAIVAEYPIQDQGQIALLRRAGLKDDQLSMFKCNIATLLKKDHAGRVKWIEDCERLFVTTIDQCAKRRVKTYAYRVAVKAALSPMGVFDAAIVVVNAVFMMEDLCRLYHVRTNRLQAVHLTGQLIFHTFISAKLDDTVDGVADTLFDGVIEKIPDMSSSIVAKMTLGVLKPAAGGAVNLLMFRRLGAATIEMLRPIKLR